MLTRLRIRNFKTFEDVEIELGQITVFVGPNNSGKTTALQALTLWYAGVLRWNEHVNPSIDDDEQTSLFDMRDSIGTDNIAALSRFDLVSLPVPGVSLLWKNRKIGNGMRIPIEVAVSGSDGDTGWSEALQFTFVQEDFLYIQSLTSAIYGENAAAPIRFLTPMSGLASVEPLIQPGRISVLIGEGQTAQVLRNLCYELFELERDGRWGKVTGWMRDLFGVTLHDPIYDSGRGETRLSYRDRTGTVLDIALIGRGALQMLLLLAYLYRHPGSVLLLDEPDAHLEILRQREMFDVLAQVTRELNSQIIMTTHSEVILYSAIKRKDTVIAFTGRPHRLTKPGEFVKSLSTIRTEDYLLAEQAGWILYTEGSTDYPLLRAFAERIQHPVTPRLNRVFHKDIGGNTISDAVEHFKGLCEAEPDLIGIGIFDRTSEEAMDRKPPALRLTAWRRREIENYLMQPETLIAYARASSADPDESQRRADLMRAVATGRIPPIALTDRADRWWSVTKASDDFLDLVFAEYSRQLGLPLQLRKADYHLLVRYIPDDAIDPEIREKLDAIHAIASTIIPYDER